MESIECVLLDIEGTICPISFVKDTLFPYALQALPDVLASKWDDEEFKPYRGAFPESAQATPEALQTHVEDLTKRDVKIAYLKNLQGYLWEDGYKTGAYSTPLFRDVAPQLKLWKAAGIDLAIYSSGSVFAQKLLFGHVQSAEDITGRKRSRSTEANGGEDGVVEPVLKKHAASLKGGDANEFETEAASASANHGRAGLDDNAVAEDDVQNGGIANANDEPRGTEDLQYLIEDWFDTTNAGPKTEASSYTKISDALKTPPSRMLFLSDNVKEVDAALKAGMLPLIVDRPGNAPVSEEDRSRLNSVNSLDEIKLGTDESSAEENSQAIPKQE